MEVFKVKNSLLLVATLLNLIRSSPQPEETGPGVVLKTPIKDAVAPEAPKPENSNKDSSTLSKAEKLAALTKVEEKKEFKCTEEVFVTCVNTFWILRRQFEAFRNESVSSLASEPADGAVLNQQILDHIEEVFQILFETTEEIQASLSLWYENYDHSAIHTIYNRANCVAKSDKLFNIYNLLKEDIKDVTFRTMILEKIQALVTSLTRVSYASLKLYLTTNIDVADAIAINQYNLTISLDDIKLSCPKSTDNKICILKEDISYNKPGADQKCGDEVTGAVVLPKNEGTGGDDVSKAETKPDNSILQPKGDGQVGEVNPLKPIEPVQPSSTPSESTGLPSKPTGSASESSSKTTKEPVDTEESII